MSKKLPVQCYLCGKLPNSYTRDHIPPKCLAGGVPNIEFMTAPACLECNKRFSSEESKFRDFLAAIGSNLGIKEADGALEAFKRNVGRRPGPNKDYDRIIKSVNEQEEIYSGRIYLGNAPTIRLPEDLDASGVIVKIAQGHHYHHKKEIIPLSYKKEGMFLQPQHVPARLQQAQYHIRGQVGEFFHYAGWWKMEDTNLSVTLWLMLFYQRAFGVAWFQAPNFVYPANIAEESGKSVFGMLSAG